MQENTGLSKNKVTFISFTLFTTTVTHRDHAEGDRDDADRNTTKNLEGALQDYFI